jgi:anthranilate synthase component 2
MVLMIDNYDSFTFNLVQYLGELGAAVKVFRNDELSVPQIEALAPSHIVISPGPCTPGEAGISLEVVERLAGRFPILGVCLGHQALAVAFGGRVDRAPAPMHGKVSRVRHDGTGILAGLSAGFEAGRYHSLMIPADAVPEGFLVSAWAEDDGVIMAVRHADRPVYGVQFHPESVLTPSGQRILQNFLETGR